MRRFPRNLATDNGQRGVSIIELLMVMVALAVMAGMGMPSLLRTLEAYRLRATAWNLAGDLRLARQKAVSIQVQHRICFTGCSDAVPAGGYLLERENPGGPPPGWVVDVRRADLPDGVTIANNAPGGKLTFDTKGAVWGAMGATMTLTNGSGTYGVVTASSGRVLVCKGSCP